MHKEYIGKVLAELYQDLFDLLSQEHNLICTVEEMNEIIETSINTYDKINKLNEKAH